MTDQAGSRRPGRRVDAQRNRAAIVERAATGATVAEISDATGLAPRTVRQHLADPKVRNELASLHDDVLRVVARRTTASAVVAVDALDRLVRDTDLPALARIAAARAVLGAVIRLNEAVAVADRLAEIERRLDETGGSRCAHG